MPEKQFPALRVSKPAQRDIAAILLWSYKNFGEAAALRYEVLIAQAFRDIRSDPQRPGSKARPELKKGARTYHLLFSRDLVNGECVKEPRHFLLYRIRRSGVVEVGRVLHDSRDLERHLPQKYKARHP